MEEKFENIEMALSDSLLNSKSATNVVLESKTTAKDILKNGILVETDKGLVCMSLKDALNNGVGGSLLSEEEFHNVATKLLTKNEPKLPTTKVSTVQRKEGVGQMKIDKETIKDEKNAVKSTVFHGNNVKQQDSIHIPSSSNSYLKIMKKFENSLKNVVCKPVVINKGCIPGKNQVKVLPGTTKVFVRDNFKPVIFITKNSTNMNDDKNSITKTNKPLILRKSRESNVNVLSDNSELSVNNLVVKLNKYETVDDIETSDNSETPVSLTLDKVVKKRGGWPKGRKRKPDIKNEVRPPKAPATGYVLFLNEKRKELKEMPFTEVTKLLGNEWSKLNLSEKKVYLDQAEVEKKRYREELKVYRQSDAYQTYLHKKRLKRLQGNGTEESDMDATDEIDDEDNEELYCRLCDQWFHSLHNKKEHLYGRQHLQAISGRCKPTRDKQSDEDNIYPCISSTSLDESSLDGCSFHTANKQQQQQCTPDKLDPFLVDDAMVKFMAINKEREDERRLLQTKLSEAEERNVRLTKDLEKLTDKLSTLKKVLENCQTTHSSLELSIYDLLSVPSMFYIGSDKNLDHH